MEYLQKPGQYRLKLIDYGLKEERSGSIAITLKAITTAAPGVEGGWVDCEQKIVEGSIYVVVKNGNELSDRNAKSLMDHVGWDGNFESVVAKTWQPKAFSGEVKEEIFNGKPQIKLAFVNGFEAAPTMGLGRARELQAKWGAGLLALGGTLIPSTGAPWQPGELAPPPAVDSEIPFTWLAPLLAAGLSMAATFC